ncbi:hypothetical protein COP2_025816 [Malus domestica]
MYLTVTRPDMAFIVSLISRYMERPTEMYLQAAKIALRYVKGTIGLGVFYRKGGNQELLGYSDSDYAGDQDDRKSTSGYVFLISSGAVSWYFYFKESQMSFAVSFFKIVSKIDRSMA